MEPWAKDVLSDHVHHRDLSIRPSVVFASIRKHECFADASDYDIRRAVWENAAKVNLSVRRPDEGKHNFWPPISRNEYENRSVFKIKTYGEFVGGHDEFSLAGLRFHKFEVKSDGLPDKEEWVEACWDELQRGRIKAGRPVSGHKWPRFRVRLLTHERITKAVKDLPFRCPLCLSSNARRNGDGPSGWQIMEESKIHCFECTQIIEQMRNMKSESAKQRERTRLVQVAYSKLPPIKPHQTIKSSKPSERAILRAVYEMGLIKEGDTL